MIAYDYAWRDLVRITGCTKKEAKKYLPKNPVVSQYSFTLALRALRK